MHYDTKLLVYSIIIKKGVINTFIYKVKFLKFKKNKKTRKVILKVLKGKTMISNEVMFVEDILFPEKPIVPSSNSPIVPSSNTFL